MKSMRMIMSQTLRQLWAGVERFGFRDYCTCQRNCILDAKPHEELTFPMLTFAANAKVVILACRCAVSGPESE